MKKRIIGLAASLLVPMAVAENLTIERIYSSPSISGPSLRAVKISPNGERVTFLRGKETDAQQMDLWEFDLATGEQRLLFDSNKLGAADEVLSDEEKARRERLRLRGSGIVSYQWNSDGDALLFPLGGDVFYYELGAENAVQLLDTPEFETDIRLSPSSNYISFIRDQDIFVKHLASGEETQLTFDGEGAVRNGMAEFVAQEEMARMTGYWWSPDESNIAFTRTDDTRVAVATRNEIYADRVETIEQKYPWAGTDNVEIALGVVNITTGDKTWIDLGNEKDIYLPRVNWQTSELLTYQWQNRPQTALELRQYDLVNNSQNLLLREHSDFWVNLDGNIRFINDGEQFIWASERSGFNHLYLFNRDGSLIRQITSGDWVVDGLQAVDIDEDVIYFTGRKDTVLERHLYKTGLFGETEITRISKEAGMHGISFAGDGSRYIDYFSNTTTPPQASLMNLEGERQIWISHNQVTASHPLAPYWNDLIIPTFGTIKADDGKTDLYYRLYEPAKLDKNEKHPALVFLYGGPGSQQVNNRWGNLFLNYMAQKGYAVITIDNRGSPERGVAFESAIHLRTGDVEIRDQIKAVEVLRNTGYVDPERVGVFGYSYGGYMSLMAMFTAPEYFKAGAAGGSVSDWRLYDTHYTERYMGHPETNEAGYEASSVLPYAENLQGDLFIYHGMADDNVLFTNSTRVYRKLQEAQIPFWSMDYPGEKHGMRDSRTRIHEKKMLEMFFDRTIGQ